LIHYFLVQIILFLSVRFRFGATTDVISEGSRKPPLCNRHYLLFRTADLLTKYLAVMDVIAIAIRELTETITNATEYQSRDVRRPQFLRMYNRDLQEDTTLLFRYLSDATNEQKLQVNELCTTARQLRRALETEAINLEIAAAEKPIPIKLPRLTLPVFDGNRSEFTFWYDFLTENVLSLNFNATAKWLYLRDCLKGRPADMIAGYPLTAETLETALKLLKDVYGNPTALRNDLFQKLEEMPQSADNSKDLRMTYCKLEGILLSLDRLGFYMDEEPHLRTLVIRKYPLRIMKELFAAGNSLNKVRQTAKRWVEIEEHIYDMRGDDPTASTSSPPVTGNLLIYINFGSVSIFPDFEAALPTKVG